MGFGISKETEEALAGMAADIKATRQLLEQILAELKKAGPK